ncbi:YusW family protein [Solibacillus sp. MA9]|uniref:YusW family protein n=1 Tax=Solibacillus palustris TaxID=2908203 RepID=A0ABS9UG28_9BACL|nr:YusW family protein [Solibacillus sp. MA9]MCH7323299.1 YusW family protein [Solibacillus sp. MA9]
MKSFRGILTLPLLLGLLYGCNNNDTNVDKNKDVTGNTSTVDETTKNNTTNNTGTNEPIHNENEKEKTGIKATDVNYAFKDFDLEVEYADYKSYDVEYENDGNYIYAEIDDEIKGVEYKGDQAYEKIVKALEQLKFDKATSDEDVRKEVLKAFALDENYQYFDLEVKFKNGEEKHYHFNK